MKTKESRLLKYMRTFIAKLLKIDVMYSFIKEQQASQGKKIDVALQEMKIRLKEYANQNKVVNDLCRVGADVHMRSEGWAVVCFEGRNGHSVVQFYRLPEGLTVRELSIILRGLQPAHPDRIIMDAPHGMHEFLRDEIDRL